jgi:hypothetical protein
MSVVSSLCIGGFLFLQIKSTALFQCGIWVFTLQAFQLTIAYINQRRRFSGESPYPNQT